jgi:tetratricopeptide (TPR) repeat protein
MTYKYGLILHTWLEYVKLLAVPHPLTNDYYPKHIGVAESTIKPGSGENIAELKDGNGKVRYVKDNIPKLGSPFVTLSILFHLALAFFAVNGLMKRKAYAFAIIFYAATFSVVSNLLFPIGTLMAERFMFMPSIGFSLLCGMGLAQLATKGSYFDISKIMMPLSVFLIVTVLYSFKTFSRNPDWKDDYSLFTKDILVSANSAKLNNAVSGVLQDRASKPELSVAEKDELYRRALYHSDNAINLHPTYNNAWLLKGNAYYYLAKIKEAKTDSLRNAGNQEAAFKGYNEVLSFYNNSLNSYKEVERLRPDHPDVPINLTAAYRDRGKLLGEKLNRLNEAVADLEMSNKYGNQKDVETLRLLGVGCGIMGMTYAQQKDIIKAFEWHTKAVNAFQKALDIAPNFVATLYNLEVAYRQILEIMPSKRDEYIPKIEEVNKKWKELDPNYNPMGQAQKTDNKVKTEEKPNEKKVSK